METFDLRVKIEELIRQEGGSVSGAGTWLEFPFTADIDCTVNDTRFNINIELHPEEETNYGT